jgi:hypothetical protein
MNKALHFMSFVCSRQGRLTAAHSWEESWLSTRRHSCALYVALLFCNVQGRILDDFDHVKRDLHIGDEAAAAAAAADPMHLLHAQGLSEDMKRVMAKLNTADAHQARVPRRHLTLLP